MGNYVEHFKESYLLINSLIKNSFKLTMPEKSTVALMGRHHEFYTLTEASPTVLVDPTAEAAI